MQGLVTVALTCGHSRDVDPGIKALIDRGLIESQWCLHCYADAALSVKRRDL